MTKFPDRRIQKGETCHFMTASGGRDIMVPTWCGDTEGRWYCVPCVEHVPAGGYLQHIKTKPLATEEHRMVWDCSRHGPEARCPDAPGIRRLK